MRSLWWAQKKRIKAEAEELQKRIVLHDFSMDELKRMMAASTDRLNLLIVMNRCKWISLWTWERQVSVEFRIGNLIQHEIDCRIDEGRTA